VGFRQDHPSGENPGAYDYQADAPDYAAHRINGSRAKPSGNEQCDACRKEKAWERAEERCAGCRPVHRRILRWRLLVGRPQGGGAGVGRPSTDYEPMSSSS